MIRSNFFFPFTYNSAGNIVFAGIIDVSASTAGIKVESTRTSPSSSDVQNVYSGTYTPSYTRTGATFSGTQTSQFFRVGNLVYVQGYTDVSAGGGTNDITVSLPITPSAFSATNAERAQCSGSCFTDSNVGYNVRGTSSGTTATIEGVPNAATGLRYRFAYRIA